MVDNSLGRDMVGGGTGGGCVDKEDIPVRWSQAVKKNVDHMNEPLFINLFLNKLSETTLQNPSYSI